MDNNKTNWLKKHSDASMVLFGVVRHLESLADAFETTGNHITHNVLLDAAADITEANKNMSDAVGESIKQAIDTAGEHSKTVLKASLAGALMAAKRSKKE